MVNKIPWRYLIILLTTNLALLLPNASALRVTAALLLIGLLPGLSWANWLLAKSYPLLRWTAAAALSYAITSLTTLLLHYLPGPLQTWYLLTALNLIAIFPVITTIIPYAKTPSPSRMSVTPALILIILLAIFLRGANLHYSEFQGDEALAMISAAEALENHEDALFLRAKGPGEVLLPMALWRLTGTITEPVARLPFTIAILLTIVTIYLIGDTLGGKQVGWLAAGFFAFNGFAVAFGRIVQYQALVLWMSTFAFLMALQWRQTGQFRLAIIAGFCLGAGLLAHYDAILVIPAILWLFISGTTANNRQLTADFLAFGSSRWSTIGWDWLVKLKASGLFLLTFLLTALVFYLPYILDSRSNRTGEYIGGRIGNQLRNNLPDFFHFNTFYSSSYYIILTSLLVLGVLIWLVWRTKWGWLWIATLLVIGITIVFLYPNLLQMNNQLNLSVLPFALLFACAFFALPFGSNGQSLIMWLAAPFLGYNFVVALGLTHIYTIIPAWSLLAAAGWYILFYVPRPGWQWVNRASNYVLGGLVIISTIFLWNAFVRHDVEYWQDYPNGNLPFYWNPYDELPPAGFFGFAHRTGWKAVGQKIASGELAGDYVSNEELDVTAWYTRGAPRACDPQPEFYFLADDLIDPVDISTDIIESNYEQVGQVTLPNQKQMQIMQLSPATLALGRLNDDTMSRAFDQSATPAVFARSGRGAIPTDVNFGNLIQLVGYNINPRRAVPGGRLPVTLHWQALAPVPASYQVFTHLESENGLIAQADGVPVCWTYPTTEWQPGHIVADEHAIPISPEVQPGSYRLDIGLYRPDTLERLDVLDEAGNPTGTSITLELIEIGR
jgi:hypothetical protein